MCCVEEAFNYTLTGLELLSTIRVFDLAHLGGDGRDLLKQGGVEKLSETAADSKRTAGSLFHHRLLPPKNITLKLEQRSSEYGSITSAAQGQHVGHSKARTVLRPGCD